MKILGIESSCDETAAAVVRDGREILSNVVASQVDLHRKYGGVVPELASRKHVEAILPVVDEALGRAGESLETIDAIAATQGPGLVGSLLVGLAVDKSLAYGHSLPWVGVNHIYSHVAAMFLSPGDALLFPFIALVVSVGIFEQHGFDWSYHAYREWQGWSLEHEGALDRPVRASMPDDRQKVVTGWFARNVGRVGN